MDERATIEIEGLVKNYGSKRALDGLSLTVPSGMFGLLGRNGAGKTTLMKILSTLLKKSAGSVRVCGYPVERTREIRRIVGYLPQDFSIYPSMRVREALDYLGVLSGLDPRTCRRRADELLERVNLTDAVHKKVRALSGGMRRRLGIAQALLHDPRVLIVDEPTAGLDPEERVRFRNLLGEVSENRIVLLSTHIVGDVEAACEEVAVLDEGRLLFRGGTGALLARAENRVYTLKAARADLETIKRRYPVVSTRSLGALSEVRFLAEPGFQGAEPCEPNIEDAYLLCLHESGAETVRARED